LSFTGTGEQRLALAGEALRLARERGDLRAVAAALASRCDAIAGPDHTAERLGAAAEIVAVALRTGELSLELLGRRLRLVALAELCDMEALDAEIDAFERGARRLGDPLYGWSVPLWRAMQAQAQGRLADCDELLAEARDRGARAGSANARVLTEATRVDSALITGDVAGVEACMAALGAIPGLLLANGEPALAYMDNLLGLPGARQRAAEVIDGMGRLPVDAEWIGAMATLADLVFDFGMGTAAPLYELLAPYSGLGVVEGICAAHRGATDLFLAKLAAHEGDEDAVVRHVERALEIGGSVGALVLADTQSEAALALARIDARRHADRITALSESATATFRRLGIDARTGGQPRLRPRPITVAIAAAGDRTGAAAGVPGGVPAPGSGELTREGDSWAASWEGTTVRIRHAKGVADLAILLFRRGREVHVRELEGVGGLPPGTPAQPALDDTAVARFRDRLRDLEEDLEEADRHGDLARAARLAAEHDAVVEELTRAFGRAGRARQAGSDPDERLRKAVSARVKASIERLEELHPALGCHLRISVRTGFWCSYQPDRSVGWRVTSRSR
jgi:hypothetical protein